MGDVINLQGAGGVNLAEDMAFVSDMCRFYELILTEKQVKKKWRFDAATWEALGSNEALVEKIEAETVRKIRDGSSKREKAQLLVVKAPEVVASIMNNPEANARHRIDAAASLDKFAANPADSGPTTSDRFIITINLGADHIEHYNKSISINADDVAPGDTEVAPTHTGYGQVDHEAAANKKPVAHRPAKTITDNRSAYDIALASLMEKG